MSESDNWARVKDIFAAALARAPQDRGPFLQQTCRDDASLREEVESLLAAHDDAEGFAETPAIAALAGATAHVGATAALTPGFELGPYRILGPLDAGAMGEVYRARDTRLSRDVAVKVLPAALAADADRITRLQREARLLAALNHPHIATIHSLEAANGVRALVMELVEGPTLAEHLARKPLTIDRALDIARQIAEALEAAHDKGIVHRDLKPANIKLTAAGTVKVLDFGLAQAVRADEPDVTQTGLVGGPIHDRVIAGTPAYMSPEQARGEAVDQRTDIWAFGCVLFEMLTGRRAFGSASIAETLAAIQEREPDWHRLPPAVPAGVRRLLRRCLERDPKRRLHHMADARIEIEETARDGADDGHPTPPQSASLVRVFAALTVVLAIGSGVLLIRRAPETPEMRVVDIATPWTSDPSSFALSPDGRRLAFVGDHQGQPTLWLRPLDAAEEAQPLAGTQGARRPFWSPDGRSIGFFAFSELKRIDADGGVPQTITSIIAGTAAAWGDAGTILFSGRMARTISPSPTGLLRVNAAGGESETVTRPAAQSSHQYPQFLPDHRQFLFFVDGDDAVRGVYLGSLDSTETTRLVASDSQGAYLPTGWLLFVRQGALQAQRLDIGRRTVSGEPITVTDSVAFDAMTGSAALSTSEAAVFAYRSGRGPVNQLAWFDRSGRFLGAFRSLEEAGVSDPALSPDGRRIVAERTVHNETTLWLLDASHQVLFTRPAAGRIARYPVWSPSGDRIAFASIRSASVQLATQSTAGTSDGQVLHEASTGALSDWSPDGRFLLYFAADPKTGTDIWILPQDTRVPQVFLATTANEMWGQFSPDGRWIAYQSNETGRFEIYVRPFPGPGSPIPISTAGGVYARWSHKGDELYYLAPDATMMAVPLRRTPTFSAGAPVPLFKTRRVGGGVNVIGRGPQYDVAPDGRFLINVEPESPPRPITLVMNWKPRAR